ncbi:metal-binding protein [Microbacteriaceae bacterium 4G12]
MPSGKTHERLNLAALPVIVYVLWSNGFVNQSLLLSFIIGFVIGTYFLSPDLDTNSSPYRKWGVFRLFWYPYKAIMPHRSILTHTIIIGDIIRLIYLLLMLSPFLYIFNVTVWDRQIIHIVEMNKIWLVLFVFGVMSASALHIIADVVNTKRKRWFRSKRRKR